MATIALTILASLLAAGVGTAVIAAIAPAALGLIGQLVSAGISLPGDLITAATTLINQLVTAGLASAGEVGNLLSALG